MSKKHGQNSMSRYVGEEQKICGKGIVGKI